MAFMAADDCWVEPLSVIAGRLIVGQVSTASAWVVLVWSHVSTSWPAFTSMSIGWFTGGVPIETVTVPVPFAPAGVTPSVHWNWKESPPMKSVFGVYVT